MNDIEDCLLSSKRIKFGNIKVGDRVLRGRQGKIHYKTVVQVIDNRNNPNVSKFRRWRPLIAVFDDGSTMSLWTRTDIFITRITGKISGTLFTESMTTDVIPYLEIAYQASRNVLATGIGRVNDPRYVKSINQLYNIINRLQKLVNEEVKQMEE